MIYRKLIVKEKAQESKITPGKIIGCIWGCACCQNHEFIVKLYKLCGEEKNQLYHERLGCCGCFEFDVSYDDCYVLEVCPESNIGRDNNCKPMLTLKNVGVSSLMVLN